MPYPPIEEARSAERAGILQHLSALLAANLGYLKARLELAGLESKEAAIHFGIILALAVGGLVMVLFGYFFFIFALIFIISWACGGDNAWIWVTLGAAVLHFVAAVGMVLFAKSRLGNPVFAATLDELKHDQEWLKTNAKLN